MNMEKNIKDMARAKIAQEVLTNEVFKEAVDFIKKKLLNIYEHTKFDEDNIREECYYLLRALKEVDGHLKDIINTGKMASFEFEKEKKKKAALKK